MAAVFGKDFSVGLAAALELVFGAALAATFDSERETALAGVLFGDLFSDLAAAVPAATFAFALCLTAAAPVAGLASFAMGVAAAGFAAAGFAPFTEDNWGFAEFFIAFAMESITKLWIALSVLKAGLLPGYNHPDHFLSFSKHTNSTPKQYFL